MEIVHEQRDLERYMREAVSVSNDSPVLLDRFLNDATEVDVDAICDGKDVLIGGIMEHIEQAGVHSGDSACSLPPYSLTPEIQEELRRQTVAMAKGLNVIGLMNVQFAIQYDGEGRAVVYVLEVNPRASRTVPYVSKATGRPLAKIAARCMVGRTLAEQGESGEIVPPYYSVKEAVFPFIKFPGVDTILGPEMKSTGEVMGVGESFGEAFVKSQLAAGVKLPEGGRAFISVKNADKAKVIEIAKCLPSSDSRWSPPEAPRRRCLWPACRGHRQQGGRRAAAHRRHAEERRDRAGRQHGRGKARGDPGQLRDPPRGAGRPDPDLYDAGRRARRSDWHARHARSGTVFDPAAARAAGLTTF
jgi:hypothetical protein